MDTIYSTPFTKAMLTGLFAGIVITLICMGYDLAFMANNAHRSDIDIINTRFHQLLVPIVVVIGLGASIGIPFLWHSRKFEEYVI